MIKVVNVAGTESSEISKDFEAYSQKHNADGDWNSKLYAKLEKIIRANPKHRYSGDLLSETSLDSVLSKKQIGDLYNELDLRFQDPDDIKRIEHNAFPEKEIKVGDSIYDFSLPNRLNKLISTNDYRNNMLFIDFWASWCKPCRAQFPELLKLNNDFKGKGLVILGVSLDNDLQKWLKAMDKDQPDWENVIDAQALTGEIAKKYGVSAVPKNFLVDEKGVIIAQDISLEELRTSMATHLQQEYKR
jgi:peroxiredoxin